MTGKRTMPSGIAARMLLAGLLAAARAAFAAEPAAKYSFDPVTGGISAFSAADGRPIAASIENIYQFMSRPGDVTARERDDSVVASSVKGDVHTFRCVNPKLPDVEIEKTYFPFNGGLRRTLRFTYSGNTNAFLLTFTECRFPGAFLTNAWHLGAGYIGPYKPFPHVETPRQVNEFRQSSKGMVLVNPDGRTGCFSHYRVKINDTVVLPWWHSTIGHYREYDDRLWYLPDGYRMGLGTLDLKRGESISVTDSFNAFDGNIFAFFDRVFGKDDEVMAEIRAIPPQPSWTADLLSGVTGAADAIRFFSEMMDDGILIAGPETPTGDWCDYRHEDGFTSFGGGHITADEMREYLAMQSAISDRVRTSIYHIVISASETAPIVKEHPEWFRYRDRAGGLDSLFPGLRTNFQTMFNNADCRRWVVDMLFGFASSMKDPIIDIDESQMTNTIDWDRETLTRDDHSVLLWRELAARASKEGVLLYFNGSGLPYAGLNCMESPHELAPNRWRDWVGVAWGIGMMNRFRPANRTVPLYWSVGLDYVNRILALGWVPRAYPNHASIPPIRAAYQSGALVPIDARYTPDWKGDWDTQVESHAMTRTDCSDKLLSFISRAAGTNDIPVTLDLSSLGFAKSEKINVWRLGVRDEKRMFTLSDRELKENWREFGWSDGCAMIVPHLEYSGPAAGELKVTLPQIAQNRMSQLLVTPGDASFFSINDKPLDYFYTHDRKGRIEGRRAHLSAPAEILLADATHGFTGVTVGGKPAKTRQIDVGGSLMTLVSVPAGDWTLDWKAAPLPPAVKDDAPIGLYNNKNKMLEVKGGGLFAIERDGLTIHTGPSPVMLPPKRGHGAYRIRRAGGRTFKDFGLGKALGSDVRRWSTSFAPGVTNIVKTSVSHGDVEVTGKARWIDRYETTTGMQPRLSPAVAEADPEKLTIESGTTRKEGINLFHRAWAGLELKGAKKIRMRFEHTFNKAVSIRLGHIVKNAGKPETNFAGLTLDFSVGGRYVKRVSMATGLFNAKYAMAEPPWGTCGAPDGVMELGDFINGPDSREFSLDIAALAPEGWDGTVYLSAGTARIMPGRRIKVTILGFNDAVRDGFIAPVKPEGAGDRKMPESAMSRPLKKAPASLKKIDASEWKGWKELEPFQLNGTDKDGVLHAKTRAWIAHDYEYIYLGVEAEESGTPKMESSQVGRNDHVEVMVVRPDGSIYQVLADAKGHSLLYVNAVQTMPMEGVVVNGEIVPGTGYRVFFALPVNALKFDMQRTPVVVKGDICRVRMFPEKESSAWAPLPGAFNGVKRYGTFVFDFNW